MTVTIDIEKLPIQSDPEILSGATVFSGTRVSVQTLFDYIEDGCSLDVFLENFPSVKKEHALKVLAAARETLTLSNSEKAAIVDGRKIASYWQGKKKSEILKDFDGVLAKVGTSDVPAWDKA